MTDDHQVEDVVVDPKQVRHRLLSLADHLTAIGALRSTAWRDAVLATPRHVFVPRFFRPEYDGAATTSVSSADPGWLDAVYSDEPLVTQFDGDPAVAAGNPTSSSTAPDLMLRMLEVLDIDGGHNVLEIGTGTGYNAALLCHRLGDTSVTSIDIDESLTSAARDRLAHLGLYPAVITGDGAAGHPDNGPYDRIIATCAVRRIPSAWLTQVAPGGFILVTLETSLHGYGLALLTIDEHHHANGRIIDQAASFMPMRSHADPAYAVLRGNAAPATGARASRITITDLDSDDARFILGLALPDIATFATGQPQHDGLYLAHHTDRSWAELRADGTVVHGGHRDLWGILETAHQHWTAAGCPTRDRIVITATSQQQTMRLNGTDLTWQQPAP